MCFAKKSKAAPAPAAAPAAPLPPPDEEDIGGGRREENIDNFGSARPTYRVKRDGGSKPLNNDNPISL